LLSLLKAQGVGGAKAMAMLISIDSTINTLMTKNVVRRQSRRWRPLLGFATGSILRIPVFAARLILSRDSGSGALRGSDYTTAPARYKALLSAD
jgi:hypothetical protein